MEWWWIIIIILIVLIGILLEYILNKKISKAKQPFYPTVTPDDPVSIDEANDESIIDKPIDGANEEYPRWSVIDAASWAPLILLKSIYAFSGDMDSREYMKAFSNAAENGQVKNMIQIKDWADQHGYNILLYKNVLLHNAIEKGHIDVARKLIEWGTIYIPNNDNIYNSGFENKKNMIDFVLEINSHNINTNNQELLNAAFKGAASGGNVELMDDLKKRGANNFEETKEHIKKSWHINSLKKLETYGITYNADDFKDMIEDNVFHNNLNEIKEIKEWTKSKNININLNKALYLSLGDNSTRDFIKEWMIQTHQIPNFNQFYSSLFVDKADIEYLKKWENEIDQQLKEKLKDHICADGNCKCGKPDEWMPKNEISCSISRDRIDIDDPEQRKKLHYIIDENNYHHCYDIFWLGKWVIYNHNTTNPNTGKPLSTEQIELIKIHYKQYMENLQDELKRKREQLARLELRAQSKPINQKGQEFIQKLKTSIDNIEYELNSFA